MCKIFPNKNYQYIFIIADITLIIKYLISKNKFCLFNDKSHSTLLNIETKL